MPVKDDLLEILCCPKSMERLKVLDGNAIQKINELIEAGKIFYENGEPVKEALQEALATVNNDRIYAVKDSIPVMLVDESIPTAALGDEITGVMG